MANPQQTPTDTSSKESSISLIENETCSTKFTNDTVSNSPSNEDFESTNVSRQRKRMPSAIMKEKMESEKFRKKIHQQEKTRAKRKYTKRPRKENDTKLESSSVPSKECTSTSNSNYDDDISEDDIDFTCCICKSDVDYTVFDNEEDESTEKEGLETGGTSTSDQTKIQQQNIEVNENSMSQNKKTHDENGEGKDLSRQLRKHHFDPNNALILCETPDCNRVYHQHCHFIPIFVIPRNEWYCLICQYRQKDGLSKSRNGKKKPGRPKKKPTQMLLPNQCPSNSNLSTFGLDQLYPPITKTNSTNTQSIVPSNNTNSGLQPNFSITCKECVQVKSVQNTACLEFEQKSSKLKMALLDHNLSKVKTTISQCLLRIRGCENAIRIYTETERARKDLISAAIQKRYLPAELVLSKHKLLSNQLRIKRLLQSLQHYIEFGGVCDNVDGRQEPRCEEEDDSDEEDVTDEDLDKRVNNDTLKNEKRGIANEKNEIDLPCTEQKSNEKYSENKRDEEEEENIITCSLCFSSESTIDNDILLCDGMSCCRAFHMECLSPKVTIEEIQNDDTWFCPYCTTLGKMICYVQNEYYGDDEDGMKGEQWEVVEDVFKDLEEDMKVWSFREDGVKDIRIKKGMVVSKQGVLKLLGLEDDDKDDENEEDDEDDESFDMNEKTNECERENHDSSSLTSESLGDVSSVEFEKIDQSEISALESGDESCSVEEINMLPISKRRKKRNVDSKIEIDVDVGTLDERNIVQGKRRRTKVDYQRLNDAMFGELEECEAKKMFGDEKGDDYHCKEENGNSGLPGNGENKVSKKEKSCRQQQVTSEKKKRRRKKQSSATKATPLKEKSQTKKFSTTNTKNLPSCEGLKNGSSNKNTFDNSFAPRKSSSQNGKKLITPTKQITSPKKKIIPQIWSEDDDNIAITSMVKLLKDKKLSHDSIISE